MMAPMNALHVACVGYTGPRRRYWQAVDTLELTDRDLAAKPATLRRWRSEAPAHARFVVRVDPALVAAGFAGPEADAAWARTREVAALLDADTLLLRTPPSFRPTAANREALRAFFAAHRGDFTVAWWADGLWESQPEDRDAVCAAAGLLPVADPLADDDEELPEGPTVYWRVRGRVGMGGRLSDDDLDRLCGLASERAGGHLVFDAPTMMNDARRFATLQGLDLDVDDDAGDDDEDLDDDPDDAAP